MLTESKSSATQLPELDEAARTIWFSGLLGVRLQRCALVVGVDVQALARGDVWWGYRTGNVYSGKTLSVLEANCNLKERMAVLNADRLIAKFPGQVGCCRSASGSMDEERDRAARCSLAEEEEIDFLAGLKEPLVVCCMAFRVA